MKINAKLVSFCCALLLPLSALAQKGSECTYDNGATGPCSVTPRQVDGGPGSLTTLFGADNSFAGNTFDVTVNSSIVITGFDINIDGSGGTHSVDMYWRNGSSVGVENDPGSWTLMGSDNAVSSAGPDSPTSVNVGTPPGVILEPGNVYGIYFDLSSYPSASVGYTNGGPTVFSNSDMTITTNTGQGNPAFSGSFFPRQWNGTVYYADANTVPTLGTIGLSIMILALFAAAFVVMRKQKQARA
jgi:hypothetical protein